MPTTALECDCSYSDGDEPRVWSVVVRRARKPHQCIECRRTIVVGEQYEYGSYCSADGDWDHSETCLSCSYIRRDFCPRGSVIGGLAELIRDCRGFDYRDDPGEWNQEDVDEEDAANRQRLAQQAARRAQDARRDWGEQRP
jgi:hypothetical protein